MRKELVARVQFKGNQNLGPIARSEVREQVGKHGLLMLDFRVPRASRRVYVPERTPMTYRWGFNLPSQARTFYGYVNHHEIIDGNHTDRLLRVYCLGTSLAFNEPHPTSWRHVTGSHIARQLAARHHLRAVLHKSPEVLSYWAQGQETDFQTLHRLCERTGYKFWVDGATLFFLNPERLVTAAQRRFVSTLRMDGQRGDHIRDLHVIAGSLAPRAEGGSAVRQIFGLDTRTGALIKASSVKPTTDRGLNIPAHTVIHGQTVRDAAEARRLSEAQALRGRWVTAQLALKGNPGLRVGDVTSLAGSSLHHDYEGLWVVEGTTNVIERVNGPPVLTTEVEISRNQATRQFVATRTPINSARKVVPAVLRNGIWESQALESVYV